MGCSYTLPWGNRRTVEPRPSDNLRGATQRHVTFLAAIEDPAVVDVVTDIQDDLGAFDCITPVDSDVLHVTIKHCAVPPGEDDWVDDAQAEAAGVIAETDPFEIGFRGLNVFDSAVFAEIETGGEQLDDLNRRLKGLPSLPESEFDHPDYWPHMTLAKFADTTDFPELIDSVAEMRDRELGTTTVDSIRLVTDWDFGDFSLEPKAVYTLNS